MGEYANLTAQAMKVAGMRLINVIGKADDPPSLASGLRAQPPQLTFPKSVLEPLLSGEDVDGMLYYPWGGGYSALHGGVWQIGSKTVVSSRFSLWGDAKTGDEMLGVAGLVDKLKGLPKSPTSADGYSLIAVNAWSHSYDDVLAVAEGLKEVGGFEFVTPSELVKRIRMHGITGSPPATIVV